MNCLLYHYRQETWKVAKEREFPSAKTDKCEIAGAAASFTTSYIEVHAICVAIRHNVKLDSVA